jgi:hypothetical protein
MTTMVAELYDALLAAGSPEDKARKAAETMAGYEAYEQRLGRIESDISEMKRGLADLGQRVPRIEGDISLLKWMMGFVLALLVAMSVKLFLH